jgi:hypothetical protein
VFSDRERGVLFSGGVSDSEGGFVDFDSDGDVFDIGEEFVSDSDVDVCNCAVDVFSDSNGGVSDMAVVCDVPDEAADLFVSDMNTNSTDNVGGAVVSYSDICYSEKSGIGFVIASYGTVSYSA